MLLRTSLVLKLDAMQIDLVCRGQGACYTYFSHELARRADGRMEGLADWLDDAASRQQARTGILCWKTSCSCPQHWRILWSGLFLAVRFATSTLLHDPECLWCKTPQGHNHPRSGPWVPAPLLPRDMLFHPSVPQCPYLEKL